MIQQMLAIWFLCISQSNLFIWKFLVHILLKPSLKDFQRYLASMWSECKCMLVWTFFGIVFLWDWNENWPFPVSTEKRCTTWELWVKFYLGQNEDCSPGDSISGSSERVLQSGCGGKSIYKVLVKGEFDTMKHSFYKRFFVSHKDLMSPWRDLVLL